jgi:anti-anti-sigma factor
MGSARYSYRLSKKNNIGREKTEGPERTNMPVTSTVSEDGKTITIKIAGRFDFAVQNEFRSCYSGAKPEDHVKFIIDMSGANYMDSSALGMLLMMREFLGGNDADISIINTSQDIRNILTVANFQMLFNMASS